MAGLTSGENFDANTTVTTEPITRTVDPMPAEYSEPTDLHAARLLLQVREDTLPGCRSAIEDIKAIVRSRHRLAQKVLDPAHGADMRALSDEQLTRHRRESGLTDHIPALRKDLADCDHSQVTTVHDAAGWVLWRFGSAQALRNGESLGLVEGASWREDAVGTNAAGTALIECRGLLCIAREHYLASHHPFACAATPLRDAGGQQLFGVLNATTLAKMAHPNTLLMVKMAARAVEDRIRKAHNDKLASLREAPRATSVELDVRQPARWSLTVHRAGTSTRYDLTSKKYVEILFLLAWTRAGRRTTDLVQDLYGGFAEKETVRGYFFRMRQEFGDDLFHSNPYRFADHLDVSLNKPDDLAALLPFSTAPAIRRIHASRIS